MKLAAKLVAFLSLGMLIVLMVDAFILLQRQTDFFETDMKKDTELIGFTLKGIVEDVWRTDGREYALRAIESTNKIEPLVTIRWVWLNAPKEDVNSPRVSREKLNPVINGQSVSFKMKGKGDKGYFYTYFPLTVDENISGAVEISESLVHLSAHTRTAFIRAIILTGLLVLLSTSVVIMLGVRMVGRPLDRIVEKIRRMGTGDFSGGLQLPGHNELSELAIQLNALCTQLEDARDKVRVETEGRIVALEQLRHEDRLKTVGRLASGIAHELGTPLNVISGRAGMIARGNMTSTEAQENAHIIKDQSDRITVIIRQLLNFARRRSTLKSSVDLRHIVHRTVDLIAPLGRKQKVTFSFTGDDDAAVINVAVDTEQIQQVLINILTNAVQAMPQGGRVELGIDRIHTRPPEGHDDAKKDFLCIIVQDEGQGISEEDRAHIFEPFFTTKDTGKGTGLGLSIAYGIVREHRGWIDVNSEVGKGSCFRIYIPQEDK
jgi:two-component system, NtrC family, sensor kinase